MSSVHVEFVAPTVPLRASFSLLSVSIGYFVEAHETGHTFLLFVSYIPSESIAARLRALFYIAVSNFVFPSCLSVVQLTYIIHDPSVVHGALVLMVGNYIGIIGVVFSTIWCSSDVWKGAHNTPPPLARDMPDLAFPQSIITLSGIAPNLTLGSSDSRHSYHSRFMHARTLSDAFSRGHRPHPFASNDPGRKHMHAAGGADSGVDLARLSKGEGTYMQMLELPRTGPDLEEDTSTSESHSRSPVTPHDNQVDIHGGSGGKQWGGFHLAERTAGSEYGSDVDAELEFTTPTPPHDHRDRYRRRSLPDYPLADTPEPYGTRVGVRGEPYSQPEMDQPSASRAHRPSFMDWSDAELGGRARTPSSDGR